MTRRLALVAVVAAVLGLAVWAIAGPYGRAATLLVLATEMNGWPRTFARLHERPVEQRTLTIPAATGDVRAHAYLPVRRRWQPVVLVSGVHPDGIDDPRLVHFARSLASVGLGTVTPDVPILSEFAVGPGATDLIESITAWVAAQEDLSGGDAVGLVGISFSGGLAIVAAGRESIRDQVAFVLSIGGHGDLLRTLDTLAGGILTDAEAVTDAFGLAIVLASVAPRVVPGDQVDALREWARTYLTAAHLPFDDPQRTALFAGADRLAAALPDPSRTFAAHARAGDSAALRPHLLQHVRESAGHPALSPERAPAPRAPVFLLHGVDDPVIPPQESVRLGDDLERRGVYVRVLLTPLLTHADLEPDLAVRDVSALLSFLAGLLRA
jgi:dienelactone hydrolase